MLRRSPISTLFPYTTLFRSALVDDLDDLALDRLADPGQVLRLPFERQLGDQARLLAHQRRGPVAELRSEEHTSELQSRPHTVCRLLREKKRRMRRSE